MLLPELEVKGHVGGLWCTAGRWATREVHKYMNSQNLSQHSNTYIVCVWKRVGREEGEEGGRAQREWGRGEDLEEGRKGESEGWRGGGNYKMRKERGKRRKGGGRRGRNGRGRGGSSLGEHYLECSDLVWFQIQSQPPTSGGVILTPNLILSRQIQ